MHRAFAPLGIDDRKLARPAQHDAAAALVDDDADVTILDRPVGRCFQVRLLVDLCGAPDMERAHGQLRARLTNRLRRDDAHRFANVYRRAACQIAAIAFRADPDLGFAHQRRADFHRLRAERFDLRNHRFIEQGARRDDDRVGLGIDNILRRGAAQNPLTQRRDGRAALHDGPHFERPLGAAIEFDNHAILADIDQTTGQIARVRGL